MRHNEICFNELSIVPLCQTPNEVENRIRQYITTLKALYKFGIKKVRYHENMVNIPLSGDMSMQQYCNIHKHDPLASLLLSTFTMPQVDENNEDVLNRYCETQVTVHKEDVKLNAHGFNAAYCSGTFCIGFQSEDFWKSCTYSITIKSDNLEKDEIWACVSHSDNLKNNVFTDWYASIIRPIKLVESTISYQDKIGRYIHLRDDHGKDILKIYAKRLLHCKYVESVVNSLPFNPKINRYILKVYDNGIINIVLHWTDKGYGMVIQTTGRNIRETQEIAKIIEKEYGFKI